MCLSSGIPSEVLVDLYKTKGDKIFISNWLTQRALGYCKYVNDGLKAELTEYLKTHTLKDTKTEIAITSCRVTDSDRPYGHVFTKKPKNPEELNYSLIDIALATSAAPTYFP